MKTLTRLGIALSLLLVSLNLKAAPIAGGHISYRAIDSVTYIVTAQIFAECDSVNPNVGDSLIVSWSGGSYTTAMTLLSITDVTGSFNKCAAGSGCFNGSIKKIYEHKFIDTVTLPTGICKITFAYAEGKRSSIITTGPAGSDFYIHASLNTCAGINNSAHITLPPQFYIAVGHDAGLSAGYIDTIDGDSLRFEMVNAKTSALNDASFSGSFSLVCPMTYLGFPNYSLNAPAGFHFDNITSQLSFRPTKLNELAVLVFEAIEYNRVNGVMVEKGRTRLEHTVGVYNSPNNKTPKLTGSGVTICEGKQYCQSYSSNDADINDSTYIKWNGGIPGSTLATDSGQRKQATFCWTPQPSDVRNWPHLFTMRVNDDGCSPNGVITRTVAVYVRPAPDSGYLKTFNRQIQCNTVTFKFQNITPFNVARYISIPAGSGQASSWSDSVAIIFAKEGWNYYTINVFQGMCSISLKDSVYISTLYTLKVNSTPDTSVCPLDSFVLKTKPLNGNMPYTYAWSNMSANTPSVKLALFAFPNPHIFNLMVIDSLKCAAFDTIAVNIHSLQIVRFSKPDSVCTNTSAFTLRAIPQGGKWTGPGIVADTIFDPAMAGSGWHTLGYFANDSNGCKVANGRAMHVFPAPVPQFTASTIIGGAPLSINLVDQTVGPVTKRTWIFTREDGLITDTITSTSSTITKVFNDTGKYHVTLINYSGICDASITKNNYITVRSTVGIKPLQNAHFRIYPNPAKDAVIVEGENILRVEITDITGKIIQAVIERNGNEYLILSPGSSGIYLLQITANDGVKVSAKVIFIE